MEIPDFGLSKDSLRNLVNLAGEFVGTTDTLTLTNKTISLNSNTLTATSGALGDLIAHDGTSYVRKAKGTANQAYVTNSGATDTGWGTLAVGGGGTGATTLTGILKGAGTSAITAVAAPTGAILGDSDIQNISGAKTWFDQTWRLRNPANTQNLTLRNPIFTSSMDTMLDEDYDFIVFIDAGDSNKVKAKGGSSRGIEFSHASDLGNVLNAIQASLSSTSGGTVKIKSGSYSWITQVAVTKPFVGIKGEIGTIVTPTAAFATDLIKVDKNDFTISDCYWDCTNMTNGTGSWLMIASGGVNADRCRVLRNRVRNAPTSAVVVASGFCNGLYLVDNYIQSVQSPTGHAVNLIGSSDGVIYGNQIGGYANASTGCGIMMNACGACDVWGNEIFTNREGIRLYLPTSINVFGNLIQAHQQHGIAVINDTATTYGEVSITCNRIHDNSTSSAGTFHGIALAASSTGLLDRMTCVGNVISDNSIPKRQAYGININTNKVTNSAFIGNAVSGNLTGGINRGTIDSTCYVFANPGDSLPYQFMDFSEDKVVTAPSDPASGFLRKYAKQIDANNDGWFVKRKVNGAVVEVML